MDPTARGLWFAGDLGDPWVAEIAESLSDLAPITCEAQGDELPDDPFDAEEPARVLILHRSRLTPADVARLDERRKQLGPERWPRIVLCVSPYVRYAELESCAKSVDLILPEATARETLHREVVRLLGCVAPPRPKLGDEPIHVEVVSTDFEVRSLLREACRRAGYRASESPCLLGSADLTVWDVPVLEPRWTEQLERRSRTGPVVALLGFADRSSVSAARKAGASACLDLPCAMDDLIHVLDSLASRTTVSVTDDSRPRIEPRHAIPAPHAVRARKGGAAVRHEAPEAATWSDAKRMPRISTGPAN